MAKKGSIRVPSESELKNIAALFEMALEGLKRWSGDDEFLINMGSISPEDIDVEGAECRDTLLEILGRAKLPDTVSEDLEIEADDLQAILPAILSILEQFTVPGLKPEDLKKFKDGVESVFAQVSLQTPSKSVDLQIKKILKLLSPE